MRPDSDLQTSALVLLAAIAAGVILSAVAGPVFQDILLGGQATTPPNVVVIDIDRLSASHMPCYGYVRNTTPNICRFGEENLLFTDAIAQSGWTASSVASLFTGQYPSVHRLLTREGTLPGNRVTLAEVLDRNGYTTAAYPGNADNDSTFLHTGYGLDQGFATYHTGGVFLDTQLAAIRRAERYATAEPFFLYVQGFDPHRYDWWMDADVRNETGEMYDGNYSGVLHSPELSGERISRDSGRVDHISPAEISLEGGRYYLPLANGTRVWLSRKDVDHVLERYDAALRETDRAVGRLFDYLRETGVYEDTIIVVTANHGEVLDTRTLFDDRRFGHGEIWEEVVHVPLMMHVPGEDGAVVDTPVELIDVFPTVLDHADIPVTGELDTRLQGDSVRPLYMDADGYPDDYAFSFEYGMNAFAARNRTWTFRTTPRGDSRLFDRTTDIAEQVDVRPDHPNVSRRFAAALDQRRRADQQLQERLYGTGGTVTDIAAAIFRPLREGIRGIVAPVYRWVTGAADYRDRPVSTPKIVVNPDGPVDALLRPNVSVSTAAFGRPTIRIDTNRYGLREEPFPRTPAPNTTRVLVIGDSYVFGSGVNASDRFTAVLERHLNRERAGTFEVINAGIPGTGVGDYYRFLKHRGLGYDPDIVIVTIIGNDWMPIDLQRSLVDEAAARVDLQHPNSSGAQREERLSRTFLNLQGAHQNLSGFSTLANISRLSREHGIRTRFFVADYMAERKFSYIEDLLRERNATLVRAPAEFRDDWNSAFCLRYNVNRVSIQDPHPSPEGHRLLAEHLLTTFDNTSAAALPWEPEGPFQWIDPC